MDAKQTGMKAVAVLLLLTQLAAAQDAKSETPGEQLDRSLQLLREGRLDTGNEQLAKATERLEAHVTTNPRDAEARFDLARAYWAAERRGAAVAAATEAVELAPDNKDYQLARFGYLRAVGRLGDTIKDVKALLEQSPDDADYWIELGRSYFASRRYDEASEAYQRARTIDDENPRLYHSLGSLYARQGQLDDAIEAFKTQAQRYPDQFDSHFNLAQIHQLRGENEEALKHFIEADRINSNDAGTIAKLVQCFQAKGDRIARDEARRRLMFMFREGRTKATRYCRDQFIHNEKYVIVIEHFERTGQQGVKYEFYVYNEKRTRLFYRIQLASSEYTTRLSIAEGRIKPGQSIYHVDLDKGGEHRSYGFYKAEPAYDILREYVQKIIDEKVKPEGTLILGK